MKFSAFAVTVLATGHAAAFTPIAFNPVSRQQSTRLHGMFDGLIKQFGGGGDADTSRTTELASSSTATPAMGGCPFAAAFNGISLPGYPPLEVQQEYADALDKVNWDGVKTDLKQLFSDSKDWWPADYGHYGGLFIRLAWHCTGSYRMSDGRGGCDGGAQRFDPERSWDDNTNLDKARRLLEPIKLKHGIGLSWGDLFVLSGTMAIEDMGGPVLGFCGGRIDHVDNSQTRALGPTPEQQAFSECEVDGDCQAPLGQNTLGLIYVNPEGPMGVPDPQGAADTIRDVFGRMDMDDRENVALIGGGHTFGKAHGASEASPGDKPFENPSNSWDGGRGMDTVTSGFEGAWTAQPTKWDNAYFKNLLNYEWESWMGPGGHYQWRVVGGKGPKAPAAYPADTKELQDIMMLTTDIGLLKDPEYRKYVEEFAADEEAFAKAFGDVWYKLVNRDMGPVSRCVGPFTAPAQEFQFPLPDAPAELADMGAVSADLNELMETSDGDDFIRLAMQSANTFRATDYLGGCNGARIRFEPGSKWPANAGLDKTLALLEPIKESFGDSLSWADLIVLAGNVAVERAGSPALPFCAGRTDAPDGAGWNPLEYGNADAPTSVDDMTERFLRRGLTAKEFVALSFATHPSVESLRGVITSSKGDAGDDVFAQGLQFDPDMRQWAEYYISAGDDVYGNDFASAWNKLMNSDRFDGPTGNLCTLSP